MKIYTLAVRFMMNSSNSLNNVKSKMLKMAFTTTTINGDNYIDREGVCNGPETGAIISMSINYF